MAEVVPGDPVIDEMVQTAVRIIRTADRLHKSTLLNNLDSESCHLLLALVEDCGLTQVKLRDRIAIRQKQSPVLNSGEN